MGIVLVLASLMVYFLMNLVANTHARRQVLVPLLFVIILSLPLTLTSVQLFYPVFVESRAGELYSLLSRVGVRELIMLDASINERVEHVFLPWHGFLHQFGIPGGFGGLSVLRPELIGFYDGLFWFGEGGGVNIMSYIGEWVFSLGLFGFFTLLIVFARSLDGTHSTNVSFNFIYDRRHMYSAIHAINANDLVVYGGF